MLKKVSENTGIQFLDQIIRAVVGLIVTGLLANHLGAEQFGKLNYSYATVGLFFFIINLGVDQLLINEFSATKEVSNFSVIKFFTSLRLCLSIILVAFLYFSETLQVIEGASILILLYPLMALSLNRILIHFGQEFRLLFKISMLSFLIASFLRIWAINTEKPLDFFFYMIIFEEALVAIMVLKIILARHGKQIMLAPLLNHAAYFLDILRRTFPLLLVGSITAILLRIDTLMIGYYLKMQEVAIYSVATKVVSLASFIIIAYSRAISPIFTKSLKKNLPTILHKNVIRISLVIGVTSFVFVNLLSPYIIFYVFGQNYISASEIVKVLSFTILLNSFALIYTIVVIHLNLNRFLLYKSVFNLLLNILLNWIFIPKYGLLGAAVATTASSTVAWVSLFFHTTFRKQLVAVFHENS